MANLECAGLDENTPLFLMTDEKDSSYLLPLQGKFNVIRANDFKSYTNLIAKYPDDNFLHFYVERLISYHAKRPYTTSKPYSKTVHFINFKKPMAIQFNNLAPHDQLPVNCEGKYYSYLPLKKKRNYFKIIWLSDLIFSIKGGHKLSLILIHLKYTFAQNMLHLRVGLRRCLQAHLK